MLFKDFLWQDFLLMAVVMALLWYLLVWLLFYRKPSTGASTPLAHHWQAQVDELADGLMGGSVPEPGTAVVAADDFGFAVLEKEEQLGLVADVQQDIREACAQLEADLAGKEVFLERFTAIIANYAIPEGLKESLGEFVREHAPFFIEQEELERIGL
ncbi:hypothetical protein ACQKCH_11120 [Nubsella zeaxanthinifaciens]|uniref:hypothetical protein n=1 Tax=Nubsella zeaxanthinifaciens TaxID=392412 RepID=UPI003CFC0906